MVKINGEAVEAQGLSIEQYLAQMGYDAARVVVERNLKIVPRSALAETVLEDGDVVEILCFVGGG